MNCAAGSPLRTVRTLDALTAQISAQVVSLVQENFARLMARDIMKVPDDTGLGYAWRVPVVHLRQLLLHRRGLLQWGLQLHRYVRRMTGGPPVPSTAAPTDGLAHTVQQRLFSDSPDGVALQGDLVAALGIGPAQAQQLIYRLVGEATRRCSRPSPSGTDPHRGLQPGLRLLFRAETLGSRRMPLETARAAIDLLFDYARDEPEVTITHFGGEPTLNFAAVKFATEYAEQKAAAAAKSVDFNMTSNGVRIDDAMASFFAEHKIKVFVEPRRPCSPRMISTGGTSAVTAHSTGS